MQGLIGAQVLSLMKTGGDISGCCPILCPKSDDMTECAKVSDSEAVVHVYNSQGHDGVTLCGHTVAMIMAKPR